MKELLLYIEDLYLVKNNFFKKYNFLYIFLVMIRAFPANAALFLGYETALKFLTWIGLH